MKRERCWLWKRERESGRSRDPGELGGREGGWTSNVHILITKKRIRCCKMFPVAFFCILRTLAVSSLSRDKRKISIGFSCEQQQQHSGVCINENAQFRCEMRGEVCWTRRWHARIEGAARFI